MKIPFSPPYIDQSVIDEVVDTLRSGWITTGPKCLALEQEIARFTGARRVLTVNSWTSGAILMLRWLGLQPDDEVIVPAYTYSATALAVLHAGGKPVMVDVGDDFNITTEAVRAAITPRTKAIIPVDFAGFPCDYGALIDLVKSPEVHKLFTPTSDVQERMGRILILNDAAHSLGARYSATERTGSETDIAIFSLHAVKNVTTAEGGAICLNFPDGQFDVEALYPQLRQMALNCQTKDAFTKSKAGGWRYDITGLGMKVNMADVNAAIGLAQIREYPALLAERKRVFQHYHRRLSAYEWAQLPPVVMGERESSYHLFALRVNGVDEAQRDRMIEHIASKDVAVNVHFIPMPMLTLFRGLGYRIEDYPTAYRNYAHEISLPIYPQLDEAMVDCVCDAVIEAHNAVL